MSPFTQFLPFVLMLVGADLHSSRRRFKAPFLSSRTALISQSIQPEYNPEALIEKLIESGDVISAETLWKDELDSGGQPSTSYSENAFVSNPINFRTTKSYIVTKLELTGTFSIYFQLKTTKLDGLIMYAGPLTQNRPDFMAVELVAGIVRFVFDVGTGIRVVRSNLKQGISNNEWHDVGILRPTLTQHILRVDDSARPDPLPDDAGNYDLNDEFYIGGLPQVLFDSLPKQVKSRHGFHGCLGSIDLNGESQNLMEDGKASVPDGNVMSGCEDSHIECTPASCTNGGICVQHRDSFTCDCELTSFTGPSCDEDGVAYTFGEGGGLIQYNYTEGLILSSGQVRLAFGILTYLANAVFMYLESNVTNDFIQVELISGHVVVLHCIGNRDHILQGNRVINDGVYHTVRFIRSDYNSTLQVDAISPVHRLYKGHDGLFGSGTMAIYIGSQAYPKNQLVKPFYGSLAGLVVNGVYIFEQIANGEETRVSCIGNVVLEIRPLTNFQSLATRLPDTPTSLHHKQQYLDGPKSEGPRWYASTTPSENRTFPFIGQLSNHSSIAVAQQPSSTKSTTSHELNNFETIKEAGIQTKSAQPLIGHAVTTTHPKSVRTRHMKQSHDNSDDLIVTRVTKSCPPNVYFDCPGLPTEDSDVLLYPATRLSKQRKPLRSGPPTIHPFNPAFHKENAGSKPCIPDDDEDCDMSSGNGAGLAITPLQSTSTAATVDDIIYVHKTDSDIKDLEEPYDVLLASTVTQRKEFQSEIFTLKPANESSTMKEGTMLQSSQAETHEYRIISTFTTQQHIPGTTNSWRNNELVLEERRDSSGLYLGKLTMNIGLIVGIAVGITMLLLVLAFAIYKYRGRSELSCSGADTKGYVYETCNILPPIPLSTDHVKTVLNYTAPQMPMASAVDKPKRRDVKEWYV